MLNDEVIRMKEELDSLNLKCMDLNEQLCRQLDENGKLCQKLEHSHAINDELRSKIRFLEGQVDAYQYCLNCRR